MYVNTFERVEDFHFFVYQDRINMLDKNKPVRLKNVFEFFSQRFFFFISVGLSER